MMDGCERKTGEKDFQGDEPVPRILSANNQMLTAFAAFLPEKRRPAIYFSRDRTETRDLCPQSDTRFETDLRHSSPLTQGQPGVFHSFQILLSLPPIPLNIPD